MKWGNPWGASWGTILGSATQGLGFKNNRASMVISLPTGVTLKELKESRAYQRNAAGRNFQRVFMIKGSKNPTEVEGVGPQLNDIFINDAGDDTGFLAADRQIVVENTPPGEEAMRLVVQYVEFNVDQVGVARQYALNIGSQTEHVTRALEQKNIQSNDSDLELIGLNPATGQVDGVDISTPYITWLEEDFRSEITNSYRQALRDLVQKTNLSDFRGWNAGEVRFDGVELRRNSNSQWKLTYHFAINANVLLNIPGDQMVSGNAITDEAVKGWEYVWFELQKKRDGTNLVQKVKAAHIARVYEEGNFASLGIGTGPIT